MSFIIKLQFIIAQVNLFHTFLQGILGIIRGLFTFNFWEILKALITFGENLRTAAYDLLKKLVGVFTDTKNWPDLKPMGKDMVDGLIEGWKENWDNFWRLVDGDFNNLLAYIASKLLIHSPSQVFAKEIGKPMAQGVQVGFSKQMGASSGAIANTLTPESYMTTGKRGGGAPTIVIYYSPTVSTASIAEFEAQFVPLVDQALRRVNRGKV